MGIIIGDDGCMVIDAQATPAMAEDVIARSRAVTDFQPTAIAPGRGSALQGEQKVSEAVAMTRDFVSTLYGAAELSVARGRSLKETFAATRNVMDPKFGSFAIYEHCLPFNVSRAFDEASGVDHPTIWTAERDRDMWAALQG